MITFLSFCLFIFLSLSFCLFVFLSFNLSRGAGKGRKGVVAAGAARAKENNSKRGRISVDDKDKGEDTRERRMGEPTGVSRVNTRGTPQEWSQTSSHDVPWPHVSAPWPWECGNDRLSRHQTPGGGKEPVTEPANRGELWPFTAGNHVAHSSGTHWWQ